MIDRKQLNEVPTPQGRINLDRCYAESDRQRGLTRRAQAQLASAGMDAPCEPSQRRWYVLRIADGADIAVDNALANAHVERWMPAIRLAPKRRGGRKWQAFSPIVAPALPGYLFVRIVACADAAVALKSIEGVVGMLGGLDHPSPIKDAEVVKLQAFIEDSPEALAVLNNALHVGDQVVIDSGPFTHFEGIVQLLTGSRRVEVELDIFGRATRVDLDLALVTRID